MYSEFTDLEKKHFIKSFVKDVFIHEQEQSDGRFLKAIKFRFPVFYNGLEIDEIDLDNYWDKEMTDETCCLLSRVSNRKPDTKVEIEIDMEEYYRIKDSNKQN